jgi:hypothetical protein
MLIGRAGKSLQPVKASVKHIQRFRVQPVKHSQSSARN